MVYSLEIVTETENKVSRFEAESILAHLLGVTRAELYIYEDEIGDEIVNKFDNLVQERATGKPLQYIFGKTEFMGLEFIVTPDVFIPRPETELLVEETIRHCEARRAEAISKGIAEPVPSGARDLRVCFGFASQPALRPPRNDLHILDMGTGSGNIAIALTKFITDCKIISSDVSTSALCIARENARLNLVDKKIDFVLSDLFDELPKTKFDIIVSNPPYVASSQIEELSKGMSFEPRIALDGGPDGLVFYRNIIKASRKFLREKGFLILEIGFGQTREVKGLLNTADFKNIRFIKDYNNINRVAVAQWIN